MRIADAPEREYQKAMRLCGIAGRLLVVLGVIGLAYPSLDYSTRGGEILRLSFEDSAPLPKSVIPDQPAVYRALIGAGIVLTVFALVKRTKQA